MLYSDNAKVINTLLAISITDMKPGVRQNQLNTSLKKCLVLYLILNISKLNV